MSPIVVPESCEAAEILWNQDGRRFSWDLEMISALCQGSGSSPISFSLWTKHFFPYVLPPGRISYSLFHSSQASAALLDVHSLCHFVQQTVLDLVLKLDSVPGPVDSEIPQMYRSVLHRLFHSGQWERCINGQWVWGKEDITTESQRDWSNLGKRSWKTSQSQ